MCLFKANETSVHAFPTVGITGDWILTHHLSLNLTECSWHPVGCWEKTLHKKKFVDFAWIFFLRLINSDIVTKSLVLVIKETSVRKEHSVWQTRSNKACQIFWKITFIIIIIIIIRVFHISVSWWSFTGDRVTASLLKSPGLFSIMLLFGWSPLVRQLPNLPGPLIIL